MSFKTYKVPANWDHPKSNNEYISLLDNFSQDASLWEQGKADWAKGILNRTETIPTQYKDCSWEDFAEPRPDPTNYMPEWDESEATHYQLYDTSEGTPTSPIFATEGGLIDWLDDGFPSVRTDTKSDEITITDGELRSVTMTLKEWEAIAKSINFVYSLNTPLPSKDRSLFIACIGLTAVSVLLFLIQLLLLRS
jgi:hypothetical protein